MGNISRTSPPLCAPKSPSSRLMAVNGLIAAGFMTDGVVAAMRKSHLHHTLVWIGRQIKVSGIDGYLARVQVFGRQ